MVRAGVLGCEVVGGAVVEGAVVDGATEDDVEGASVVGATEVVASFERLLDRLEDDPHAAASDLAQDAKGSDALGKGEIEAAFRPGCALEREQRVKSGGEIGLEMGMPGGEGGRIELLPRAPALEEELDGLLGGSRLGAQGDGRDSRAARFPANFSNRIRRAGDVGSWKPRP